MSLSSVYLVAPSNPQTPKGMVGDHNAQVLAKESLAETDPRTSTCLFRRYRLVLGFLRKSQWGLEDRRRQSAVTMIRLLSSESLDESPMSLPSHWTKGSLPHPHGYHLSNVSGDNQAQKLVLTFKIIFFYLKCKFLLQ